MLIRRFFSSPVAIVSVFFLLAAIIRFGFVTVAYYGVVGELYRDLNIIWRLFHFHEFPLLGPSSILGGFYFGAIYYYIIAVFVRLAGYAPYGGTLASSFFSLMSLLMLYQLCKRWFSNPWIGVMAVAIQAIALFDIQNAYYISNPNLLPFFVLSFFYFLTKISEDQFSVKSYFFCGLALGVAVQLHASALAVLPVILLWVLWRQKIRPGFLQIILFLASFLAVNLPYLLFVRLHGLGIFEALFSIANHQMAFGSRQQIIIGIFNFFGSFFIFKDGFFNFYQAFLAWFFVAVLLTAILVLTAFRIWHTHKQFFSFNNISPTGKTILFSWLCWGVIMFIIFSPPPAYYYFIILWPLPVILVAWWLSFLWQVSKKYFMTLILGYSVLQLLCLSVFYYMIYKPQYSNRNLTLMFSTIAQLAANKSYAISNQALDVNQFNYYLTYQSLASRQQFGDSYVIFFIYSCSGKSEQGSMPGLQIAIFNGFCVNQVMKVIQKKNF